MLSVVFRCGEFQFSGATQLLPQGLSKEQSDACLKAFGNAIAGKLPDPGTKKKLPPETFRWREFRTSTKNLLMGIANSLRVALPPGWNLQACCPQPALVPRGLQSDRLPMLQNEKEMLGLDPDMEFYWCYNYNSGTRWPDFYSSEDHFKLVFAADEGTEACFFRKHWSKNSVAKTKKPI